MSYIAETTILCKRAHSEGARKSLEGAEKALEGAHNVLEVHKSYRFIRFVRIHTNSYEFVRLLASGAFSELSYASGQNARRRQTYARDEKLNRSNQRKVCAAIRDIIMSYVTVRRGNDNFVQKGAFRGRAKIARGCGKSPRGRTQCPRGAKSYFVRFPSFSFAFLRFPTFSYDSLPFVHFPELSYASGQNARRCQTNPRDEKLNRSTQRKV